jgi:hypothetical protein
MWIVFLMTMYLVTSSNNAPWPPSTLHLSCNIHSIWVITKFTNLKSFTNGTNCYILDNVRALYGLFHNIDLVHNGLDVCFALLRLGFEEFNCNDLVGSVVTMYEHLVTTTTATNTRRWTVKTLYTINVRFLSAHANTAVAAGTQHCNDFKDLGGIFLAQQFTLKDALGLYVRMLWLCRTCTCDTSACCSFERKQSAHVSLRHNWGLNWLHCFGSDTDSRWL